MTKEEAYRFAMFCSTFIFLVHEELWLTDMMGGKADAEGMYHRFLESNFYDPKEEQVEKPA